MLIGLAICQVPIALADPNYLNQLFPALVGIQITSTQQNQIKVLNSQIYPQIQDLLTPEQLNQFQAFLAQGKGMARSLISLDLSISQKIKLLNISRSARSQLTNILTPEQKTQLSQNIQFQINR